MESISRMGIESGEIQVSFSHEALITILNALYTLQSEDPDHQGYSDAAQLINYFEKIREDINGI